MFRCRMRWRRPAECSAKASDTRTGGRPLRHGTRKPSGNGQNRTKEQGPDDSSITGSNNALPTNNPVTKTPSKTRPTSQRPDSATSKGAPARKPAQLSRGDQAQSVSRSGRRGAHNSALANTCARARPHVFTYVKDIPDLPALAVLVEGRGRQRGDLTTLRAAFYKVAELCTRPGADLAAGRSIIQSLAAAYLPLVKQLYDVYSCVAPLYACAKMSYWEGGLAKAALQQLTEARLWRGANGQCHANLWWALSAAPPDLAALTREALDLSSSVLLSTHGGAPALNSQDCANMLIACARLKYGRNPALLHHVTSCLAAGRGANAQELANGLYALGELAEDCGHKPQPADLEQLIEQAVLRLRDPASQYVGARGARAAFSPQGLSTMMLGCVKLGYGKPELLQPWAAAAGRAAPHMSEQDLANSVYCLAKLACDGEAYVPVVGLLLAEMHVRLQEGPERFAPQNLANLLLSLEALRPADWEHHAGAIAEECRWRCFAGFKALDMASCVWALAKLGWDQDQSWYAAAVVASAGREGGAMQGAQPQNWSNLLYGLALVRHRPDKSLMSVMMAQSCAGGGGPEGAGGSGTPLDVLRAQANGQECSNLLWALAVLDLGMDEEQLVDAVALRLAQLLEQDREQLACQAVVNSLWALGVIGPEALRRHRGLVAGLLREVLRRWDAAGEQADGPLRLRPFVAAELVQLWQLHLELAAAAAAADADSPELHLLFDPCANIDTSTSTSAHTSDAVGRGSLAEAARSAARAERVACDPNVSQLQIQVLEAMKQLRWLHTSNGEQAGTGQETETELGAGAVVSVVPEYEVESLCCRVDMLVELADGRRVAVEVDGPYHFMANEPFRRVRTGRMRLRDRQLRRVFGAADLVTVPYWEWQGVRFKAAEAQTEYVCQVLGLALAGC